MTANARLTGGLVSGTALLFCLMTLQPGSALAGGDIKDIIGDLYGGDGITLDSSTAPGHDAHFTNDSSNALDDLSDVITSNANVFALPSASGSYTYDVETGAPLRTTDSFGPILTERAQTIGLGKFNFGFFFSHTKYKEFEGDDLDDLQVRFDHVDCAVCTPSPPSPGDPAFELDTVDVNIDLELEQSTFALFGTYGITNNWDVSALTSLVYVDSEATAHYEIIDNGGGGVHFPPVDGSADQPDDRIERDSLGFGDVLLRTKFNASDYVGSDESQWIPNTGLLAQFTLPTGDEDDLQGLGEFAALGMLIASEQIDWAGPHVNVGFEAVPGDNDLSNLRYAGGLDVRVLPELTTVADVIGRWHPDGDNRDLVDLSLGAKWDPFDTQSPLIVNFVIPINKDTGLRPDFVWSLGGEITF